MSLLDAGSRILARLPSAEKRLRSCRKGSLPFRVLSCLTIWFSPVAGHCGQASATAMGFGAATVDPMRNLRTKTGHIGRPPRKRAEVADRREGDAPIDRD